MFCIDIIYFHISYSLFKINEYIAFSITCE